jgi:hypothetical protein
MDSPSNDERRYLEELCAATGADTGVQVSMSDVGAALGLAKAEAGMLAEELIIQGLAELKSLSGGIGITVQGVEMIRGPGSASPQSAAGQLQGLGGGVVLGEAGRLAVEEFVRDIRAAALAGTAVVGRLEETVIDLKTIEVQLLSPNPKTEVIRQILISIQSNLAAIGLQNHIVRVQALIKSRPALSSRLPAELQGQPFS